MPLNNIYETASFGRAKFLSALSAFSARNNLTTEQGSNLILLPKATE